MYMLLPALIFLSACNGGGHEVRSLTCLGFCTEQRVEKQQDVVKDTP